MLYFLHQVDKYQQDTANSFDFPFHSNLVHSWLKRWLKTYLKNGWNSISIFCQLCASCICLILDRMSSLYRSHLLWLARVITLVKVSRHAFGLNNENDVMRVIKYCFVESSRDKFKNWEKTYSSRDEKLFLTLFQNSNNGFHLIPFKTHQCSVLVYGFTRDVPLYFLCYYGIVYRYTRTEPGNCKFADKCQIKHKFYSPQRNPFLWRLVPFGHLCGGKPKLKLSLSPHIFRFFHSSKTFLSSKAE